MRDGRSSSIRHVRPAGSPRKPQAQNHVDREQLRDVHGQAGGHEREANRLRDEFRSLFYFNEALIPLMKKGGVDRVQLYDLSKDLGERSDLSKERPPKSRHSKRCAQARYLRALDPSQERLQKSRPLKSCAQARWFVRVTTLPCRCQHVPHNIRWKNTYVSDHFSSRIG